MCWRGLGGARIHPRVSRLPRNLYGFPKGGIRQGVLQRSLTPKLFDSSSLWPPPQGQRRAEFSGRSAEEWTHLRGEKEVESGNGTE